MISNPFNKTFGVLRKKFFLSILVIFTAFRSTNLTHPKNYLKLFKVTRLCFFPTNMLWIERLRHGGTLFFDPEEKKTWVSKFFGQTRWMMQASLWQFGEFFTLLSAIRLFLKVPIEWAANLCFLALRPWYAATCTL